MILCYAWTNTQIINLANAVMHDFAGVQADLIILNIKRIDFKFVQVVKRSNIFRSVFLLEAYSFPEGPNRLLSKLCVLARAGAPMRYYRKTLNALCGEKEYDWLLTSGYFAETLFVLRILYAVNPQVQVAFIEEGTATYYRKKTSLCQPSENNSLPSRCKQWLFHKGFLHQAMQIVNTVYLYRPAFCRDNCWRSKRELPLLTPKNSVYGPLIAPFATHHAVTIYTKNKFYYIASPYGKNRQADERQNALIAAVCYASGTSGVVVKLHPSNLEDGARPIVPMGTNAVVDDGNYPLEAVLCHVNLEDKVFISDYSTLLMVPKFMMGTEAYLLFLYRLCARDSNILHELGKDLAADLKTVMPPEKIKIPASVEEMSAFINQAK